MTYDLLRDLVVFLALGLAVFNLACRIRDDRTRKELLTGAGSGLVCRRPAAGSSAEASGTGTTSYTTCPCDRGGNNSQRNH